MKKSDNNAPQKNLLTQEGFDKLNSELKKRKTKMRNEIANSLEQATEQGDLSENAAYKAALEQKELNENRIAELEDIVASSEVSKDDNSATVGIGETVVVKKLETNQKLTYTIVGQSEADPAAGMISIESPVGKEIYGKRKGDKFSVNLPSGTVNFQIVELK